MSERPAYRDATRPVAERAADLLARMTLEEKLAQIGSVWASAIMDGGRFSAERAAAALVHGTGHVTRIGGSTVLGPSETAAVVNDLQRWLARNTRLGIPALVHEESCAGYLARGATQFAQAIGLASSFDPSLVERVAEVIRVQMRAVGALQTLAPVLDVARDPRWGRCEETFGEDPYLAGRLGVAYVRGVQGPDLREGVAATGKHFMGYGASEGGLNWAPSPLPRRELLERILPPFAAAIREAGLASIMNGYQEIDGVPCGASRWLLTDLLRGELGFDGVVVADYFTVICLATYHRIASDKVEAARRALDAGLDVELPVGDCFGEPLAKAVRAGLVDEALVDRAATRMLRLKLELGLFERAEVDAAAAPAVFDTPDQRALARQVARKSLVLLRNDGDLLPLSPDVGTIAVIGPNAASIRSLQGDYHFPAHLELVFGPVQEGAFDPPGSGVGHSELLPGRPGRQLDLRDHFPPSTSVLDGIRAAVSARTTVLHAVGCPLTEPSEAGLAEAVAIAERADVAVVVLGGRSGLLHHCTSGEAVDRATLGLPGSQPALLEAVAATGTPVVVVLVEGRPLVLSDVVDRAPAWLLGWLPGPEGGHAIADVLFGRAAPGGRLPITLPRAEGQLPLYYNHKPSGARSQFHGPYRDLACSPLFPFGHGLSYGRFTYRDFTVSPREPDATGSVALSFELANEGERAGEEVAQLYVCDRVASVTRPVRELKGFVRVALAPGESRRVSFRLDLRQLAFHDLDMEYVVEPGDLEVGIGGSSAELPLRETLRTRGERTRVDPARVRPTEVTVRASV